MNLGEYLKDVDQDIVPQDPLLDHKVPRPIMERGYCGGFWSNLEETWKEKNMFTNRDCSTTDFTHPLSRRTSKESIELCTKTVI